MTLVNISSFAFTDTSMTLENESIFLPMTNTDSLPNVYYIFLDAYAGESVLNSVHNFDNSDFLKELELKDFQILDDANTNYAVTTHVMSSVLNMQYINEIGTKLGKDSKNVHPLYDLIENNKVMKDFKSMGYEIIVLGSSHKFSTDISVADEILCISNDPINSEFNINLIKTSILKPIYSLNHARLYVALKSLLSVDPLSFKDKKVNILGKLEPIKEGSDDLVIRARILRVIE